MWNLKNNKVYRYLKGLFSKKQNNSDYFTSRSNPIFTKAAFDQIKFIDHINDQDWNRVEIRPSIEYIPKDTDISIGTIVFDYKTDLDFLNGRIYYNFKAFEKIINGVNVYKYEFREINRKG